MAILGPVSYWFGSFCLGGIPFALLIGRARGVDIRTVGSQNVGATNLGRSVGWGWGVGAFFLDAGKGAVPVLLGPWCLGPETSPWVWVIGGGCAIVGHCYSPYLGFRGGKGVATAAGVLFALDWRVAALLLGVWVVALFLLRRVGLASSTAAVAAGVSGLDRICGTAWLGAPDPGLGAFLLALAVLVLARHRRNLKEYLEVRASRGAEGGGR